MNRRNPGKPHKPPRRIVPALEPVKVDHRAGVVYFADGVHVRRGSFSRPDLNGYLHKSGRTYVLRMDPGVPGLHDGRPITPELRFTVAARHLELESREDAEKRLTEARKR